jgi:hypothetical protein
MAKLQHIHNDSYELFYINILPRLSLLPHFDIAVGEDISFYYNIDNNLLLDRKLDRPAIEFSLHIKNGLSLDSVSMDMMNKFKDSIVAALKSKAALEYLYILKKHGIFLDDTELKESLIHKNIPYTIATYNEESSDEKYLVLFIDIKDMKHKICRIKFAPLTSCDEVNFIKIKQMHGNTIYAMSPSYLHQLYNGGNTSNILNIDFKKSLIDNVQRPLLLELSHKNPQYSKQCEYENEEYYTIPIFLLYLLSVLHRTVLGQHPDAKNILSGFLDYKKHHYRAINEYILHNSCLGWYANPYSKNVYNRDAAMLMGYDMLEKYITDMPDKWITVFRITRYVITDNNILHNLSIGDNVIFPNYVSTSTKLPAADSGFTEELSTLVCLEIRFNLQRHNGLYFSIEYNNFDLTHPPEECEILLRRNCKFTIIDKKYVLLKVAAGREVQKLLITLEMIGSEALNDMVCIDNSNKHTITFNKSGDVPPNTTNINFNVDIKNINYKRECSDHINRALTNVTDDMCELDFIMNTCNIPYHPPKSRKPNIPPEDTVAAMQGLNADIIQLIAYMLEHGRLYITPANFSVKGGGSNEFTMFQFDDDILYECYYAMVCCLTADNTKLKLSKRFLGYNFINDFIYKILTIHPQITDLKTVVQQHMPVAQLREFGSNSNIQRTVSVVAGGALLGYGILDIIVIVLICLLVIVLLYNLYYNNDVNMAYTKQQNCINSNF